MILCVSMFMCLHVCVCVCTHMKENNIQCPSSGAIHLCF